MQPKKYLYKLAQAVSKRCGISIATCQVVLPALFDEMRYTLCEGTYRCVTVESFGTFIVKQLPKRNYIRRMPNGSEQTVDLLPKLVVKFSPTRHFRQEIEQSHYDPTRESFQVHPDDRPIRTRKSIKYTHTTKDSFTMSGTVHRQPIGKNDHKIKILHGEGETGDR